MIPRDDITGAILAGGRGRRMGGADKGLVDYDGRPLIAHVIDAIRPQVGPLILSVNRHQQRYAAFGLAVVRDDDAEFASPLAGIARVFRELDKPYLFIAPCDMPLLPADLAARLAQALTSGGARAAVARSHDVPQPLCMLVVREPEEDLSRFRASGDARVTHWVRGLRHETVDFTDRSTAFRNINAPAYLAC